MTSVYTNIARKRIEQSQEASQNPSKATEQNNQKTDQQERLQEKKVPYILLYRTKYEKKIPKNLMTP